MGVCYPINQNEKKSSLNSKNIRNMRINEVNTSTSKMIKVNKDLINVFHSLCKLKFQNIIGTGFLIKLNKENKDFFCLMTNEHIIKNEMIESNEKISILYNIIENKHITINLNTSERFINSNKDLDITIIEILPKDKINEDYFLLPYTGYFNNLKNEKIFIPHFSNGQLSYSQGNIKEIKENELTYNANILPDSSGSPIFLDYSKQVFGIHKHENSATNENCGTLLYPIIQSLKKDNNINQINSKYIWENGDYFIGPLLNGLPNGKGEKYFKNGAIYEGNFVNGKIEGYGKYIYEDGDYYIGQGLNNNKQGKGKTFYKNNKIMYEGEYSNDKREGNGKYIYENGSYYIGQWLNDIKHGKGKEYYINNNIKYDGDYAFGKRKGNGKYIWEDGTYYIGQWSNDKRNGKGKTFYKNGNIMYEGDYVNDKREGFGKYIYENGEYYIGQYLNDKPNGKGKLYYKNGSIKYEGDFKDDKVEGNGKYIREDSTYYIGQWSNNLRHGKGKEYSKNGDILQNGNFSNGNFIR